MTEIRTIGFIGLGNMGMPIVTRLIEAGYAVTGFDVAPEPRAALTARGGTAVETLAAVAADVDLLILMLPDSKIVAAVMSDPGLKAALHPGLLVIDMGSSEP